MNRFRFLGIAFLAASNPSPDRMQTNALQSSSETKLHGTKNVQDPPASSEPPPNNDDSVEHDPSNDDIPRLPEPDPDSNLPRIKLGETISFEEMGPIILNVDGSTRRIENWDQMTEKEQEVTWRRIRKRNEERRKRLLLLQEKQSEDDTNQRTEKESSAGDKTEL